MHVLGDHLSHRHYLLLLCHLIGLCSGLALGFDLIDLVVLRQSLRILLVNHGLDGLLLSSPRHTVARTIALRMSVFVDAEHNGDDGQRHQSVLDEWS